MPFPNPLPSQVIRYSYLWCAEHAQGREEGVKDRPSVVVLLVNTPIGSAQVTVLPVTHSPPSPSQAGLAIEIPPETKRRLGLDSERSWIMLSEANRFTWPGPDLRMASQGNPETVIVGQLPRNFFRHVRDRFIQTLENRQARIVPRSE